MKKFGLAVTTILYLSGCGAHSKSDHSGVKTETSVRETKWTVSAGAADDVERGLRQIDVNQYVRSIQEFGIARAYMPEITHSSVKYASASYRHKHEAIARGAQPSALICTKSAAVVSCSLIDRGEDVSGDESRGIVSDRVVAKAIYEAMDAVEVLESEVIFNYVSRKSISNLTCTKVESYSVDFRCEISK